MCMQLFDKKLVCVVMACIEVPSVCSSVDEAVEVVSIICQGPGLIRISGMRTSTCI
jgi:hypothetical protein